MKTKITMIKARTNMSISFSLDSATPPTLKMSDLPQPPTSLSHDQSTIPAAPSSQDNADQMDVDVDVDDELFNDDVDSIPNPPPSSAPGTSDKAGSSTLKEDEADSDEGEGETNNKTVPGIIMPELPEFTKKDKTIHEILEMMEDYYPIIPDAITDYYLTKNGLACDDVRIKRILALATQKFVSDIATDAYEYSRIRSQSTVYNSSNPQARAKALIAGANGQPIVTSSNSGNNSKKVVLTTEDLSSALSEYGLNVTRPDFYR